MPFFGRSLRNDGGGLWLPLVDLLAATLMVFMLVTYVQKLFSIEDLESLWIRQGQQRFADILRERLESDFEDDALALTRDQSSLVLTFSDRVLFEPTEHRLKPEGRQLLRRVGRVIAAMGADAYDHVQVEGHTDSLPFDRPSYPSNNWQLSAARAIAVVELLSGLPELEAERFSASGYSHYRPVSTNETPEGRSLNRRIEIRIFFPSIPAEIAGTEEATDSNAVDLDAAARMEG